MPRCCSGPVRERFKEDLVNNAENAGICANADGESGKRYESEPWIFAQSADSLADILPQNLERTPVPHVARPLFVKPRALGKLG